MQHSTIFGIDSHARTTTICALDTATGEVETRTFRGNGYGEMRAWMARFAAPARGVYEAGCTGYVPARELSAPGVEVVPIAPSKMPASAGSRARKSDRGDALALARNEAAGALREVWVPDAEVEGLRDLCHALDDLRGQRSRAYQRVSSLLLRHGHVWDRRTPGGRPKRRWGSEHWAWLRSLELPSAGSQAAYLAALAAAESARDQYDELLARAREVAAASSLGPAVEALRCLKCVGFVAALAFCAEVGDFSRFRSGRAITSYLGLAPSESSSGERRRTGPITRCGSGLARSLLVECSWGAARARPSVAKRCPASVDARLRARAARLSRRLAERRRSLLARGVAPCKANVATAAELGRFMLFLGREAQAADAG